MKRRLFTKNPRPNQLSQRVKAPRSAFQQRVRWIVIAVVAIGLVVFFMLLAQTPVQSYEFSTTNIAGDKVSLSDYRGHVVMVNFWATWCPPCRAEMPMIESAFEQYRSQGFVVLAVNNAERLNQVDSFATEFKLTFPVLLDYSADISSEFGIKGYPTSIFFDTKGNKYATHQGMLTAAQLQSYISTGLQHST